MNQLELRPLVWKSLRTPVTTWGRVHLNEGSALAALVVLSSHLSELVPFMGEAFGATVAARG